MKNMPVQPASSMGGKAFLRAAPLLLAAARTSRAALWIPTTIRPVFRWFQSLAFLLAAFLILSQNAFAQKGNKPPGRNGKPNGTMKEDGRDRREYELAALLPQGFRHLRNEEVHQLEQLSRRTLAAINSTPISPDIFPHPSQLFRTRPTALANSADKGGESLAGPEIRGLRILSLLELEQRRTLGFILEDYRRDSEAWQKQADQLVTALITLRENPGSAALRKLDADSRRPLAELAKLDANLALLQVRTFLRITKSLKANQVEAILLAIVSSAALEINTPEMQEVEELLGKISPEAARDLKHIAFSFGNWLLPPEIAPADTPDPAASESERRGGGRGREVDSALLEFLTVLRGSQHQLLLSMLTASGLQLEQAAAAQAAVQTALRSPAASPVPDERNLRNLFQQLNRLLFTSAADDICAAEAFRQTLSDVQKEHPGIIAPQQTKKLQGAQ